MMDYLIDEHAQEDKREIVRALDMERENRGITQCRMAILVGTVTQAWNSYITKDIAPKLSTLCRALRVLGIQMTLTNKDGRVIYRSKEAGK